MTTITAAVRQRKSIRGFKPDPVPKEVLGKILQMATRSPSAGNIQPWEISVVTGEVLENIKRGNVARLTSGAAPEPDVVIGLSPAGIYGQRRSEFFAQLYYAYGIARGDEAKRFKLRQDGYRFYDAPVVVILSADCSLDENRTQFDIGLIAQTICLIALEYSLGTCIQIGPVLYPEIIRKFLPIPESKRITVSIAIGYPDWDLPENKFESKREPFENVVRWHGFD